MGTIVEENSKTNKELDDRMEKAERLYNILRSIFLSKGNPKRG